MNGKFADADEQQEWDNLQRSERRYRRLFEAARDGILLLEVDTGQILDANPFMMELLGYSRDDLIGKELWEIGLFVDREASRIAFEELRTTGYIRYEDLPLETRGGERREVEFVSNVYPENGTSIIQCNVRDITDRKRLERRLNAAFLRERRITDALQRPLLIEIAEDAFPNLLLATLYEPALDEALIGGDFYDAFVLLDGRVAIAIADTSGKGLIAAARTIQIKDVLRAFARESPLSPADVVTRLNRFVCDTQRFDAPDNPRDDQSNEWFTCLILAFVDPATGEASFVSAGCEPPLLLRRDGETEIVVSPRGPFLPLGISRAEIYFATPLHLDHGDTILMVTDGITEARHSASGTERESGSRRGIEFLGIEGLTTLARYALAAPSLKETGHAILQGARAFGGGILRDDACLLIAQRRSDVSR